MGLSAIILGIGVGLFRFLVLDWTDPLHCGALLNRGSWLDKEKFTWQPDGCMLHDYRPRDVQNCIGPKQIVFIGDSTTRVLFYQTAHMLDSKFPTGPPNDNRKHVDVNLTTSYGADVSFIWDPYLNSSQIHQLSSGDHAATSRPALLVIGSGLWYLRYANASGGLRAWETNMERILNNITMSKSRIADSVVFLPVEQVVGTKLSRERAATMRSSDIDAMNSDLLHRINPPAGLMASESSRPRIPVAFPQVFNRMLDGSMTEDGLHFNANTVRAQASILLNMRCNNFLPKSFPLSKTCCFQYPSPSFIHTIVLLVAFAWGPYLYFSLQSIGDQGFLTWFGKEEAAPLVLSAAIAFIYVADRSGFWLKEHKHFDPLTFGFFCCASLLVGFVTVKRSDKDLGFLNRDQTDEWKGWMQFAILIYHYLGASKISGIYNPIRVLVAAYLFMTGFGHTTYYLRKADFGFLRVAQVLIRLNFLTMLLAYTMDIDYLSYYFSPLVSMWYLVIYLTMATASRYNERTLFVFFKILVSATLFTMFMREEKILKFLFGLLERLCNIHWSAREWDFRVSLDMWIVYVGMLFALVTNKFHAFRLSDDRRWPIIVKMMTGLSVVALIWFFAFEISQESKFTYNAWHPYISFIPILAFVALRNATGILRSAHSRAFAFVGKCSLETFIMQYHIWLAGDTKGVLLIISGTRWRPINFILTTVIFIYLSDRVAQATGYVTSQICGGQPKTLPSSVSNQSRNDASSRVELLAGDGLETPKEFNSSFDGPQKLFHFIPPQVRLILQKFYQSVEGRVFLIILLMWLVNLAWPHKN